MVKDKKIFVPTVEASLLTGFPALETLIRSLYPAFQFNQKHGGDADYANITDVPSYSWSYASVLSAAGLKYFISGCDNDNGPILLYSRLNEKSPFWWEGPDGGRILMWYSWVYSQLACLFGGLQGEIAAGHDSIPIFLQAYSHPEYKSDSVMVYGTQGKTPIFSPTRRAWRRNGTSSTPIPTFNTRALPMPWAHRRAIRRFHSGGAGRRRSVLGIRHRFHRPLRRYRTRERTASAGGGEVFHHQRPGQSAPSARPRSAEAAVEQHGSLRRAHLGSRPQRVAIPKSQETAEPVGRQGGFCDRCQAGRRLRAAPRPGRLADYIYDPKGTLLVFNPLSWQRSSLVEMDLDKGLELVDLATQPAVPYEVLSTGRVLPAYPLSCSGRALGGLQGLRAEGNQSGAARLRRPPPREPSRISTTE